MRFRIHLIMLLLFCLLAGCATSEPAITVETSEAVESTLSDGEQDSKPAPEPTTEPVTETTEAATEPPVYPDKYELDFFGIPMIYINTSGEDAGAVYRLAWNLETGTYTEPEFIYRQTGDQAGLSVSTTLMTWPGGNAFSGNREAFDVQDGIIFSVQEKFESSMNYGSSYFVSKTGELAYYTEEGILRRIELAKVPDDVYASATLMTTPIYAAVNGETVYVVYMDYKTEVVGEAIVQCGILIYTSYLMGDPAEEWKIVQMPEAYHPSILATTDGVSLIGEKLYMPSLDDIVILDLESGELSFLGVKDKLSTFCEGKTNTYPGQFMEWVGISGCYHDVLVVLISLYDSNGIKYYYTAALQNDEVLAVAATRADDLQRILYDSDLNEVGRSDVFLNYPTIKYAKDS